MTVTVRSRARVGQRVVVVLLGVLGLLAAMLGAASAGPVPPAAPTPPGTPAKDVKEIPLTPQSLLPESVVYHEPSKAFFASSENGGAITEGYLDGRPAEVFLPPGRDGTGTPDMRTEAVGLGVDAKNRLYVAGGASGSLSVYDIRTKALLHTFETGRGGYLNDLTITRKGDVYATDSFRPRIYRISAAKIDAKAGEPEIINTAPEVTTSPVGSRPPKPFNANGIRESPDGKYIVFDDLNDGALYVMTPPPPGKVTPRTIKPVTITGGNLGDADGLEFVGNSLYVADNGGERILRLDATSYTPTNFSAKIGAAVTAPQFHTPTGIAKAPGNRLLVANSELFDPNGPPFFVDSIARP